MMPDDAERVLIRKFVKGILTGDKDLMADVVRHPVREKNGRYYYPSEFQIVTDTGFQPQTGCAAEYRDGTIGFWTSETDIDARAIIEIQDDRVKVHNPKLVVCYLNGAKSYEPKNFGYQWWYQPPFLAKLVAEQDKK